MSPHQIAAIALSVLALGAGAVGAVQVTEHPLQTAPPEWTDTGDGEINISVEGPVEPGETVTLTATYHDEPVPHAPVEMNGEVVGETNESGMLEVEAPGEDEFEVEIEPDFEGEREIPLSAEEASENNGSDEENESESEDYQIELSTLGNVTANESVTVLATVNDTPLYGAEISVNGDEGNTTNVNGTLAFDIPAKSDELELEAEYEHSGEYELEFAEESDEEMDEDTAGDPIALSVDGTFASGEDVTITATSNGTADENATVTVNDETVGQTSADGEITVTIPENAEEVEIEIESEYGEAELAYEFDYADSDVDAEEDNEVDVEQEDHEEADDDEEEENEADDDEADE
jgi:hypothetical protein